MGNSESFKVIENSEKATYFIDSYYDKESLKNYIIIGNKGYSESHDFIYQALFQNKIFF